jgi:putative Mn2+ efflux pump MntP
MILILFSIAMFSLLTELFLVGTVAGFFQKKVKLVDLIRFFIPVFISFLLLIIGIYSGNKAASLFSAYKYWYAASILFIFSLKLMYDGSKLNTLKKSINPIDKKGLYYLSILMGINAFFIGLAFGFIELKIITIVYIIFVLYFAILGGYITGFNLKKLISFRNDLFFAIIFLLIAIFVAIKF